MRNDKKPNAEKDDPGPQVSLASKTLETNVSLTKEVMMLGIMLYADLCDTDYSQTFVSNCSSTFFESVFSIDSLKEKILRVFINFKQ